MVRMEYVVILCAISMSLDSVVLPEVLFAWLDTNRRLGRIKYRWFHVAHSLAGLCPFLEVHPGGFGY
jgi:hypothetical protein